MHITKFSKSKGGCITVQLDNGQTYEVFRDYACEIGLSIGQTLSDYELKEILENSDYYRAKSRAVWYLSRGDLSKKALLDKLCRAGFNKTASIKAVEHLTEIDLVNDFRYAENFARRKSEENYSIREIKARLYAKGIDRDTISAVLSDFDVNAVEQIREIIQKKYALKLQSKENVPKVYAALARRGFNFDDIKCVLKEYDEIGLECE